MNKKIILVLVLVLVFAALGIGAYLMMSKKNTNTQSGTSTITKRKSTPTPTPTSTPTPAPSTKTKTKTAPVPTKPEPPTTPGCHVFAPTDCNQPVDAFKNKQWHHDVFGDASSDACLNVRKNELNEWCGRDDLEMHYNAVEMPEPPTTPGCHVFAPTDCHNPVDAFKNKQWHRDTWGEENRNALNDSSACLDTRKNEFNEWCQRDDIIMHHNRSSTQPTPPTTPGCYVFAPTDCHNPVDAFKNKQWHRDTWGEENRNALNDKSACLDTRKNEFNEWCQRGDIVMHHN